MTDKGISPEIINYFKNSYPTMELPRRLREFLAMLKWYKEREFEDFQRVKDTQARILACELEIVEMEKELPNDR